MCPPKPFRYNILVLQGRLPEIVNGDTLHSPVRKIIIDEEMTEDIKQFVALCVRLFYYALLLH